MKKTFGKQNRKNTVIWSVVVYTGIAAVMLLATAVLIKKEVIGQHDTKTAAGIIQIAACFFSCLLVSGKQNAGKGKRVLLHASVCLAWTLIWNVILYRHLDRSGLWVAPAMVISCFCVLPFSKSSKMTKVSYGKMKQFRHI